MRRKSCCRCCTMNCGTGPGQIGSGTARADTAGHGTGARGVLAIGGARGCDSLGRARTFLCRGRRSDAADSGGAGSCKKRIKHGGHLQRVELADPAAPDVNLTQQRIVEVDAAAHPSGRGRSGRSASGEPLLLRRALYGGDRGVSRYVSCKRLSAMDLRPVVAEDRSGTLVRHAANRLFAQAFFRWL